MKGTIFAVVLLTIGCFALPLFAQQQDLQEVMNATNANGAWKIAMEVFARPGAIDAP